MDLGRYRINPALVIVDVQNGFVSKGGSYEKLGMSISHYQKVIPKISQPAAQPLQGRRRTRILHTGRQGAIRH